MFKDYIDDDNKWLEFLNSRLETNYDTLLEKEVLKEFIENKKYKEITIKLKENNYNFSTPRKKEINKNHTNKKRVVYSYKFNEMVVLKYIAYNLYQYDYLFQSNLYSFRKKISVKQALDKLSKKRNLKNMYGYKVDIKNYFNSVDISILINNLKKNIEDQDLLKVIVSILSNKEVSINNTVIEEEKGIMAGIPLSAFLANYFIKDIDEYFAKSKVLYLRYSDDIIIFTNTKEEQIEYSNKLKELLMSYNLQINPDKEEYYEPHDTWEFLGFSYKDRKIDLSANSLHKIKGKIRRSARSIRRWMLCKQVEPDKALKVMIRKFNTKFYSSQNTELSWKYWYFPIINTSETLKIVDDYLQQYIRYIYTGKHNKKNFKVVPYSKLKRLGYKSLVHEYYLFLNMESNV